MNGQIQLTDDQKILFEHADRLGRERLLPFAERMDQDEWWPEEVFPELGGLGYLGMTIPERYGGAGLGLMEAGLVAQAFARWNHAFSLSWAVHDSLCTAGIYNKRQQLPARKIPAATLFRGMVGVPGFDRARCWL